MKQYMLDTDICSYIIRERPVSALKHFQVLRMDQVYISIVTYAELLYGVERSCSRKINRPIVDRFIRHLTIIKWGEASAEHYANIRSVLDACGKPIGAMDMMIAAHARSLKTVLVTNNQKHFSIIKGLKLENWV